jgi:hypothetical protein
LAEYTRNWVPRWDLRSTKILAPTTQVLYSSLVPEVRIRNNTNVLLPLINQGNRQSSEAQNALTELFHDINLIWEIRDDEGNHQRYFCLDRPRLLSQWPEQNPENHFS